METWITLCSPSVAGLTDMGTTGEQELTTSRTRWRAVDLSPMDAVVVPMLYTALRTRLRTIRVTSCTCRNVASRARISSSTFLIPCSTVV